MAIRTAYEVVMPYHLHMPSYFLGTFTEYPYNELSVSERKEIARGLKRLALDPCLGDWVLEPTRIHSLNSMGHNWWISCACMGVFWH